MTNREQLPLHLCGLSAPCERKMVQDVSVSFSDLQCLKKRRFTPCNSVSSITFACPVSHFLITNDELRMGRRNCLCTCHGHFYSLSECVPPQAKAYATVKSGNVKIQNPNGQLAAGRTFRWGSVPPGVSGNLSSEGKSVQNCFIRDIRVPRLQSSITNYEWEAATATATSTVSAREKICNECKKSACCQMRFSFPECDLTIFSFFS